MRFNIAQLLQAGFEVHTNVETIEIQAPPMSEEDWRKVKSQIAVCVNDPGLQDYVLGTYLIALQRAMILELAE